MSWDVWRFVLLPLSWPCWRSERRISWSPEGVHRASSKPLNLDVRPSGTSWSRSRKPVPPRAERSVRVARAAADADRARQARPNGDASRLLNLRWGDLGPGQAQLTSCVPPASSVRPVRGGATRGDLRGWEGALLRASHPHGEAVVGPHTAGFGLSERPGHRLPGALVPRCGNTAGRGRGDGGAHPACGSGTSCAKSGLAL